MTDLVTNNRLFPVSDAMVDRGAEQLRQHCQGGKNLRPWSDTPNGTKKKWRVMTRLVLEAASNEPK